MSNEDYVPWMEPLQHGDNVIGRRPDGVRRLEPLRVAVHAQIHQNGRPLRSVTDDPPRDGSPVPARTEDPVKKDNQSRGTVGGQVRNEPVVELGHESSIGDWTRETRFYSALGMISSVGAPIFIR